MQVWVHWMLCQHRGAFAKRGGKKQWKKKKNETTKCGLKKKAPISCLLLIHAVVSAGVPFFDPRGEGMAQKLVFPTRFWFAQEYKEEKLVSDQS